MAYRKIKNWVVPVALPDAVNECLSDYPGIFRQILYNRGIHDAEGAFRFISADLEIHSPFLLKDIDHAVARILRAIEKSEKIMIFGDYDVDGVTATVLLYELIRDMNGQVMKFIPNRFDEGYGFSMDALQSITEYQPELVITVDCGVRSVQEIERANELGMDIIVTDHHQPHEELPTAFAIVCPKQPGDEYPFKELSGVGISYKLAEAVCTQSGNDLTSNGRWLDLVALGTIADLAPLVDENRALVRKGLEVIRRGERPGLVTLAKVSGIDIRKTTSENIGFMLGPRLNAAGRLSSAEKAFRLLISNFPDECAKLALNLDYENSERQDLTRKIQQQVESEVESAQEQWLLFDANPEFNEGVIGLAASRLAETYYRPSIIGTINGEYLRASCRSIPEINITNLLDQVADLLVQHGGHSMAAGLTMEARNQEILFKKLSALIEGEINGEDLHQTIEADAEVSLPELHPKLLDYFPLLEPTGNGNPPPLFVARSVEILYPRAIGRDNKHLRFRLRNTTSQTGKKTSRVVFDAVAFNFGYLQEEMSHESLADILFSYEWNEYNGNRNLQLSVRDIHLLNS